MALATLSTAWCSFESAAWTRKSNRLMNEFNAQERKAGLLTVQGMQQATIHTGMFMQALAAHEAGNDNLVNFYVERFPPELRNAYNAWLAQKPATVNTKTLVVCNVNRHVGLALLLSGTYFATQKALPAIAAYALAAQLMIWLYAKLARYRPIAVRQ
jgi:hypothetical protein